MGDVSDAPVTILMTDVEGSTDLHTRLGDVPARDLIRHHEVLVRGALAEHGGHEVKTMGDGFLAYFSSTRRSLACAMTIQRLVTQENSLRVRIGLHAGEVIHEGNDIHGAAVAAAARIMSEAAGGEIVASDLVRQLAGAAGVRFLPRGQVQLKGLEGAWLLYEIEWREESKDGRRPAQLSSNETGTIGRGVEQLISSREAEVLAALGERLTNAEIGERLHISIRTVESHVSALLRKLGASHRRELAAMANTDVGQRQAGAVLPAVLTSFVGREDELRVISSRLSEARLVMLRGPGGVGKTRLAIEIATAADESVGPVWFADLTAATDIAGVVRAVATSLGVMDEPGRRLTASVVERLRDVRALVVLDNCEQVLDAVAELVALLLGASPGLRVLATSREALDMPGEIVVAVAPLGTPDLADNAVGSLTVCDAVRLFVDRATAIDAGFSLSEHNASAVASMCRRLDGIPLAIELAAAQLDVLDPIQLDALLEDRFAVLQSEGRGRQPRHRTLETMLASSYDRLDSTERATMDRVAVFRGTFSLDAVRAVVVDDPVTTADVLRALTALARKSLVVTVGADGERRFRLLETVREYARQQLIAVGDLEERRERHFRWVLDLASRAAEGLAGPEQIHWLDALDDDLDNIEAALEWSVSDPTRAAEASDAVLGLYGYWIARGTHRLHGVHWSEATATAATNLEPADRSKALMNGALLVMWSDLDAASELVDTAKRLSGGDTLAAAYTTVAAAFVAALRGDNIDPTPITRARDLLNDDVSSQLWAEAALGWASALQRTPEGAHQQLLAVAHRYRDLGDHHMYGGFLSYSANIAVATGNTEKARAEALEALEISREVACPSCESQALASAAMCGEREQFPDPVAAARRAVELAHSIRETLNVLAALDVLTGTLAREGSDDDAVTIAAAATSLRSATGFGPSLPGSDGFALEGLALARSRMDSSAFDERSRIGASLDYQRTVDYAIG